MPLHKSYYLLYANSWYNPNMYTALYIEINLIAFITLFWILRKLKEDANSQTSLMLFSITVTLVMVIICTDMAWSLIDGKKGIFFYIANNVLDAAYMALTGLISFFWLLYTLYAENRQLKIKPIGIIAIAIPEAVLFVLSVMSPWTGWIFTVDFATNKYHQGDLLFIQQLITLSYYLVSTVRLGILTIREKSVFQRQLLLTMMMFVIWPLVGDIFYLFFSGLPLAWPTTTLSLLMVFINMQNAQIVTDALTGLNNRRRYQKYVQQVLSAPHSNSSVFVFIIDITHLNKINEEHSHSDGDDALVETAMLLRKCVS